MKTNISVTRARLDLAISLAAVSAVLAAASAANAVPTTVTFSQTGGEQTFVVPISEAYTIVAAGAQGGDSLDGEYGEYLDASGGLGAEIGGSFTLTAGDVLDISVGVVGYYGVLGHAGGGGGRTAVSDTFNTTANPYLLIAGGGGGAGSSIGYDGLNASLTTNGTTTGFEAGGVNGFGGYGGKATSGSDVGGGGGGTGIHSGGGQGMGLQGGQGGNGVSGGGVYPVAYGGYGGGGGADDIGASGGGGGGYSGGAGGDAYYLSNTHTFVGLGGGGGGSYNASADPLTGAAENTESGFVVISFDTPAPPPPPPPPAAVPEPATWALMLIGFGGVGTTMRARRTAPVRA